MARIFSHIRLLCLSVLTASSVLAADFAVLKTGFRIRAESYERINGKIRLHTGNGGHVDLSADSVVRFEPVEQPPEAQAGPAPLPVEAPKTLDELVEELAAEMSLHPALVHSVIKAESN